MIASIPEGNRRSVETKALSREVLLTDKDELMNKEETDVLPDRVVNDDQQFVAQNLNS